MQWHLTRPWLARKTERFLMDHRLDDGSDSNDGSVEHPEVFGRQSMIAKGDLGESHTDATDLMGSFSSLASAAIEGETDGGDGHEPRRFRSVAHKADEPFVPKADETCPIVRGDVPDQRNDLFWSRCDAKPLLLPGPSRRWRPVRHSRVRLSAASWVTAAVDGFRNTWSGLVSQLVQNGPIVCQHSLLVDDWDGSDDYDDVDSVFTLDDRNLRVDVGALPAPSISGD